MKSELSALRKLTQMIVDNPMETEPNIIIKTTLNALPYPIFIIDSLYNIKFVNNYLSVHFNIDGDKIINEKYTDDLFKDNNFKFADSLTDRKGIVGLKNSFYVPEINKNSIYNRHNKVIGYVCVVNIHLEQPISTLHMTA